MKTYSTKLEDLLKDGFTKRFAQFYLKQVENERQMSCYDQEYVKWAHNHGFYAESAYSYGLNDDNVAYYLSDYDYYKVWPLNSWQRIWINDKLTLKYMLAESPYGEIMPKYYFYSAIDGLKALIDNPCQEGTVDNFITTLMKVGTFACKPCNGTTAIGFFKLSFDGKDFYMNQNKLSKDELSKLIVNYPNYIFTEYIRPAEYLKKFSDQIHTLRIVTLNENGDNPRIVGGYLRFPNKNNGDANYSVLGESDLDKFNLFVEFNPESGHFGNAKKTFVNKVEDTDIHPDTGARIEGSITNYHHLKELVLGIAQRFNTLAWLGFDIGVTENGFKCMEINSHPGIKYMQIYKPLMANSILQYYFNNRLDAINSLGTDSKISRNGIIR